MNKKTWPFFATLLFISFLACSSDGSDSADMAITSIEPSSGYCGDRITIHGNGFADRTSQMSASLSGTSLRVISSLPNRVVVELPLQATSGRIKLSRGSNEAVSEQDFTFLVADPPVINSFSQDQGFFGDEIVITGENFDGLVTNNQVSFWGVQAEVVAASQTSLRVKVPFILASSGKVKVTVKGQSAESTQEFRSTTTRGSWNAGWNDRWHDGAPVESEHFVVYSEKSSQVMRAQIAAEAETALEDIKSIIEYREGDFDFQPNWATIWGSNKIHILADYGQNNFAGLAYRDGLIVRAKDSPRFNGDTDRWQRVFQHEITHVTEFLMIGDPTYQQANTVWMREGFASYGARIHTINTVEEIEAWQSKMQNEEGGGNPIGIEVWSDFPQSVLDARTTIEYYPFFELAVRYLLDPNGHGKTMQDIKAFFNDLGLGIPVSTAFVTHFEMTLDSFQENYWSLMKSYLNN